jgi:hypothetical protein
VASVIVPQGPHIPKNTAEWDRLRGKVHTRTKSPEPLVRKLDHTRPHTIIKDPGLVLPMALVAVMVAVSAYQLPVLRPFSSRDPAVRLRTRASFVPKSSRLW